MKKFLLTITLSIIGFIGFSNAQSFSSIDDGFGNCLYDPDTITISDSFDITSVSVGSCDGSYCYFGFSDYTDCYVYGTNGNLQFGNDCPTEPGTYGLGSSDHCFSSITFGSSSSGGSNSDSEGGQIIVNGTSELSPVITSIFSVMGEFIPYVVYVGIGILLVTLGFYAIKWLMSWLSRKITKYFK